jgi:hypothetical protein
MKYFNGILLWSDHEEYEIPCNREDGSHSLNVRRQHNNISALNRGRMLDQTDAK